MGFILKKIYEETGKHTLAHQLAYSPPTRLCEYYYLLTKRLKCRRTKTRGNPYGLHYDGDHDNVLFTKWASEDTH